jgi:hypothetical protein
MLFIVIGMVYGALVTLEPFLMIQTEAYREQIRAEKKVGHRLARSHPMLPYREEKMLLTLSFMLCVAVGAAILVLGGFHLYLIVTAQTTIEFHANWANQRRSASQAQSQGGKKWKNPYDQSSWRRNWQQVYGTRHWCLAILPSRREPDFLPVPIPFFASKAST